MAKLQVRKKLDSGVVCEIHLLSNGEYRIRSISPASDQLYMRTSRKSHYGHHATLQLAYAEFIRLFGSVQGKHLHGRAKEIFESKKEKLGNVSVPTVPKTLHKPESILVTVPKKSEPMPEVSSPVVVPSAKPRKQTKTKVEQAEEIALEWLCEGFSRAEVLGYLMGEGFTRVTSSRAINGLIGKKAQYADESMCTKAEVSEPVQEYYDYSEPEEISQNSTDEPCVPVPMPVMLPERTLEKQMLALRDGWRSVGYNFDRDMSRKKTRHIVGNYRSVSSEVKQLVNA